jgi:hypothetical protein
MPDFHVYLVDANDHIIRHHDISVGRLEEAVETGFEALERLSSTSAPFCSPSLASKSGLEPNGSLPANQLKHGNLKTDVQIGGAALPEN